MAEQIVFDKLRYVDRLTAAGVDEDRARAHADALDEALRDAVATKADLRVLETTLRNALAELETRLTVRMGGIVAAGVAVLAAIKFL